MFGCLDFVIRVQFYDIIHFHISLESTVKRKYPLFLLAKLLGKKTIVQLHCGTQIDEIWNKKYNKLFRKTDVTLVLSDILKKRVLDKVGCTIPIKVLYNPCPEVTKVESYKNNIILFSGTLYKGKGYHDLILAFSCIAKNYPNWTVVFAGNGEIENGKTLAKNLGIEHQIEFAGWVSGEKKDYLFRKACIFCLPSYAEGFPMAVLDAWAYGLPVITTPVGGIPDVAIDGENMLLFNPGDIQKLSENIERLITDEPLRNKISRASIEFANGKFNINTINRQLGNIYDTL